MTVKEWINKLQQMPQDADVFVRTERKTEHEEICLTEYIEDFDLIYIYKPKFDVKGGVENDDRI